MILSIVGILLISYALGNLNGAIIISRLLVHDDVRNHGSGNAGLTNFFRIYGGFNTLLVFAIDFGKAFLSCRLGGWMLSGFGLTVEGMLLGALGVALGHDFPAALGFKGGKGIICGMATAVAIDIRVTLLLLAIFIVIFAVTRYVSLGSLMVSAGFGILVAIKYHDRPWAVAISLLLAVLAIYMHRSNIRRLLKGEESRLKLTRKKEADQ